MSDWRRHADDLRGPAAGKVSGAEEALSLLHEIDLRILDRDRDESLSDSLSFIAEATREVLGADHTHILLQRGPFLETTHTSDVCDKGQLIPLMKSLTGDAFRNKRPVCVPDVMVEPHRDRYVPLQGYEADAMQSLLAVPIELHGVAIGVLNSESISHGYFRDHHVRIAVAIASQIALALEHEQMFAEADLFESVDRLIFDEAPGVDRVHLALKAVLEMLVRLRDIEVSAAQLFFVREDELLLEVVHSTVETDIGRTLSISSSVCGRAVLEKRTVIVDDVSADPDYKQMLGENLKSEIAVPLLLGADELVLAVLNVESPEEHAFGALYRVVLERFARKVTMMLAFARLRSDIEAALEIRHASDLMAALGDRTGNWIHKLVNALGAMRFRLDEIVEDCPDALSGDTFLASSIAWLSTEVDKALVLPERVGRIVSDESATRELNAAVRDAVAAAPHGPGVVVRQDLSREEIFVQCYSLDLVIDNLLHNAIDALEDRGGTINVRTYEDAAAVGVGGRKGWLEVTDDGPGLSPEALARLFEFGASTKSEKKDFGWGLWWVKNCLRRSDGDIRIETAVGSGTRVIVKIPLAEVGSSGSREHDAEKGG